MTEQPCGDVGNIVVDVDVRGNRGSPLYTKTRVDKTVVYNGAATPTCPQEGVGAGRRGKLFA